MAKKYMSRKARKVRQGLLITLVTILGLGALTVTGKLLDDKYDWVEKTKDLFVKPDVEEEQLIQLKFNYETLDEIDFRGQSYTEFVYFFDYAYQGNIETKSFKYDGTVVDVVFNVVFEISLDRDASVWLSYNDIIYQFKGLLEFGKSYDFTAEKVKIVDGLAVLDPVIRKIR